MSTSTSTTEKDFDPAVYIHTQRRAASLHAAFFQGVSQAPASYLSLGRELHRLARALEHLVGEIENANSKTIRIDNAHSATEGLGIALDGVDGSLVDVERTLISLHVDRHATERWIYFAIKTQFHGSDERLRALQKRIGYHCWAFEMVMRTLMGSDSEKMMASIQAVAVAEHLPRVLSEQLQGFERDVIARKLESNCAYGETHLFEDFPADTIIRIIMFWAFKAISRLNYVMEAKQLCPIGYLNLLKAAWLLQRMQSTPSISPRFNETRAAVALVSTELLFTLNAALKVGCSLDRETVLRHGDFRIFPKHLTDQYTAPKVSGRKQKGLEQEIFDGFSPTTVPDLQRIVAANAARSHPNTKQGLGTPTVILPSLTPPPPPPYTPIAAAENQGPICPPPLFPPPRIPQRNPRRKKRQPNGLRVNIHKDHDVLGMVTHPGDHAIGGLPTPPCSAVSTEGMLSSHRTAALLSPGVSDSQDRAPSPTPSAIIDELYCDSPTLGLEDCFDIPVKIEPWTPERSPENPVAATNGIPSPRFEQLSQSDEVQTISDQSSSSSRGSSGAAPPSSNLAPNLIVQPTSPNAGAMRQDTAYDVRTPSLVESTISEEWNADVAVEYGSKPGEREIMPQVFGPMRLMASQTFGSSAEWEDCSFRLFENQSTGKYRLLTLLGGNADQRNVSISATELVPEYGYHENLPVIYLRAAGQGAYSPAPNLPRDKNIKSSRKSSVSSNPGTSLATSLYYKFLNLIDMFNFQQAFMGETIEADVQNIRSVRYTRGFLSGEHTTHRARIQLWKPSATELSGGTSTHRSSLVMNGRAPTMRSTAPTEVMRVKATRLVIYLDGIIISIFVTDDLVHATPVNTTRTLRIRPSSHRTFNNPSSVKACVLGDPKRDLIGGFRLDKEGLGIERQDTFEDFKWFEIEFQTEAECRCFGEDFSAALQQRRRERLVVEELKKKAGRGVKAGEAVW